MHGSLCLVLACSLSLTAAGRAQVSFLETEPNETKATATVISCLSSGDSITGTTTGLSSSPGSASWDNFRVSTCPATLGIYEHKLALTTTGPTGHAGLLRGRFQSLGVIDTASDAEMQYSSTFSTPPATNVWYGFGKQEELYYRVSGSSTTTAAYTSTLTTTPIAPLIVPGQFNVGMITITGVGVTTIDTDLWLYDGNLDAIFDAGSDEPMPPATITARPAAITRTLAQGTYTIAVSDFNLANDLPAATDDAARSETVLDFPNAVVCSSSTIPRNVGLSVSDGVNTQVVMATKSSVWEIVFITFTVGAPPGHAQFCASDATFVDHATPCPCGNTGATGRGCGHSFDAGGALLSATGAASNDDIVLHSQFEPATSFTLFLQHSASGDTTFHDGVLCASGTLVRLRGRAAFAGEAFFPNASFPQDQTITLSQRGGTFPGAGVRRYYSAWFRNASTTFCPPATANVSNGVYVDW